jgi:glycosyltransferase involved in cell wall biosynthesis
LSSTRIILDLSRTLSRAGHAVPTGIDRVEMAYAQYLLAHHAERVDLVALHPLLKRILPLPHDAAARFIAATAARWQSPDENHTIRSLARRLHAAQLVTRRCADRPSAYLLMSHHHLDRRGAIARFLRQADAAFVCLVHDLIPIEFPEYGRPGQAEIHRVRMETVAALADAIVTNSAATARSLQPFLDGAGRTPPVLTALLGVSLPVASVPQPAEPPYFVCIGTIEPRKNHLLLLHLWRRMASVSKNPPGLVIIGRRGWENENVIDIIERCEVLRSVVDERNEVSDRQMRDLLLGARALLLPSFAEGYGLPLAEALALGVPALCADLPALREVGGDVPEYLDPLDGRGWMACIAEFSRTGSDRRAAQLARLARWRAPNWHCHFQAVMELVDEMPRPLGRCGRAAA